MGSGKQWMSWVMRADAMAAIQFLLATESVVGPINVMAPTPVRNTDFAKALGHVLHRPVVIFVPQFVIRLALGEMAQETILASQRGIPQQLTAHGFRFQWPTINIQGS